MQGKLGPCETPRGSTMEGHEGHTMQMHDGHSMPGHEGHSMPGHGGNGSDACIMTMSWNSYTQNVCIITPAWHIRSSQGFVLSMLVILGISVAYEYLKWVMRCLDVAIVRLEDAQSTIGPRGTSDSEADLLSTTASLRRPRTRNAKRIIPMTYSDLVANDTAERGDDTGSSSPKRGAKPTSCALLRLLYVALSDPDR